MQGIKGVFRSMKKINGKLKVTQVNGEKLQIKFSIRIYGKQVAVCLEYFYLLLNPVKLIVQIKNSLTFVKHFTSCSI